MSSKSEYGRWDPAANAGAGDWVNDDLTSTCIDAGHPISSYENEPEPNGGRINMGAYGNTPEASKSAPLPLLTVQSSPVEGIAITGNKPGLTTYSATCSNDELVSLTAPETATVESVDYEFARWHVDGTDQADGQRTAEFTMDVDRTAVVEYVARQVLQLTGDVNADCRVDILDMIDVRNRINEDVHSEDNWKADVNNDGKIDILDLIVVRNNLNATCGE